MSGRPLNHIAVAFSAALIVSCSAQEHNSVTKIAYIAKVHGESFHDSIASGVRKEMAKLGVDIEVFSANSQQDVETQIQALKMVASSHKYSGLMLAPNDSVALIPFVANIDSAGIPFILIDTPLADTSESRFLKNNCGFVGTDNVFAGKLAAQYINENVKLGTIFLMRGNHKHRSSIDRELGFVSEISKNNKFKLIGYIQGWWEEGRAYSEFASFMKKLKKPIAAVFAYSDPMALGISRYYAEHPGEKRPIIVGVDGTLVGQKGLLQQRIDASVAQAPEIMGQVGLRNLVNCKKNLIRNQSTLTPVTLLKTTTTLEGTSE